MARRARGRPFHGWLILDKPTGLTSAAAVAKAKWSLDAQKAGHAGTLDPAATGVLALAFGEATKTVPFITQAAKTYRFVVRWGSATASDDAEGAVLARSAVRPTEARIRGALHAFTGDIMQVPPQVSAVKVAGERAYDRVRAGETVELAPRPLRVERLELLAVVDTDTACFEMICGKGGYVRSLARDLGEALGCLGHVTELRRVSVGPFSADRAISMALVERLSRSAELEAHVLPISAGLDGVRELRATPEGAARLRNGNPGAVAHSAGVAYGSAAWASIDGEPLAIGSYRAGQLHPARVFRLEGGRESPAG